MDKDRIAGSAKDFAGKVEGAVGDMAGDARTQASGRARECPVLTYIFAALFVVQFIVTQG